LPPNEGRRELTSPSASGVSSRLFRISAMSLVDRPNRMTLIQRFNSDSLTLVMLGMLVRQRKISCRAVPGDSRTRTDKGEA
jgi:hypothetical protein